MSRKMRLENLESRLCMDSAWVNPVLPLDVNDSGLVTPIDALQIINQLNRAGVRELPLERPADEGYFDTNADGRIAPLDVLQVLNALERYKQSLQVIVNLDPANDPNLNGVVTRSDVEFNGVTLSGVHVEILRSGNTLPEDSDSFRVESDDAGNFSISVALLDGQNTVEFVARDPLGRTASTTRNVRYGNLVHDWNATILNVVREWSDVSDDPYPNRIVPSEPPRVARNMAMIQTAMFDAINAAEGQFDSYLPIDFSIQDAISVEAAAAAAAHRVASSIYGEDDEWLYWNATLEESLRDVPDGEARANGITLGHRVADAMLDLRNDDGSAATSDYSPGDQPGDWNRTLPGFLPPLLPHWRNVKPFIVDDVTAYRPEPPPPLSSQEYAASLDEVMRLGAANSQERTAEQTEIAVFWADGAGTYTPPGHWNQIAADVSMQQQLSVTETARMFALLNLALADAGIAAWDAKYEYDLWRPIDAIRQASLDGNLATSQIDHWQPLLPSPPFPTYTSGHSTFSGAADAVLTYFFGHGLAFSSQQDGHNAPGQRPVGPTLLVTREFMNFTHAADEAGISRIYGGIHFGFDNTAGLSAGRQIGEYVARTTLAPLSE